MSKDNSTPPSPGPSHPRRASFSPGQALSDLFRGRARSNSINAQATSAYPGPISTAAAQAQAQQRRFSINANNLPSTSPTQTSPIGIDAARRGSGSSFASVDENAVDDSEGPSSPSSPFARRLSFGARALRDVQAGNGVNNGTKNALPPARSRFSRGGGEGFKWSESLRSRAERASMGTSPPVGGGMSAGAAQHRRTPSTNAPPVSAQQPPKSPKVPDHFQERILKGDFYMD